MPLPNPQSPIPNPPLNGWLILDKPLNITSAQAIGKAKRLLKTKKAGHAGTLDPLASGILPVALGEATKTMSCFNHADKEYEFTVTFGAATSTDDLEGEVIETSSHFPTQEEIEAAIPAFSGEIAQIPPAFSAKKIDGQRAYDLARRGETVELKASAVRVYSLELTDVAPLTPSTGRDREGGTPGEQRAESREPKKAPPPSSIIHHPSSALSPPVSGQGITHATFRVACGKGTYVRSLARDLAQKLGTCGHISMLRRTRVGKFSEKNAISLEKLEEMVHKYGLSGVSPEILLPIDAVLDDIPVLHLSEQLAEKIRFGQTIRHQQPPAYANPACVKCQGQLVALGELTGPLFRPARIFNL